MNPETDHPSKEISNILNIVDKTILSMEEKSKSSQNVKLDQKSQAQIISDIDALNASLVDMSKVCLKKIDEMAKNLPYLEKQVDEMDGILDFIKETAGSALLGDFTKDNYQNNIEQQNQNSIILSPPKPQEFTFPGEGYTINMDVLNQVGRQVGEQNSKIDLIIATEPSDIKKRNKVWSMQGDFFKSPNSNIKNDTSFSTLYYT